MIFKKLWLKKDASHLAKVLILAFAFVILGLSKSDAITFGKEVLNAKYEYPTVLSIWYKQNSYSEFQHMCTGTLIEPRIVLTAAHCVLSTGLIQVGYGGNTIDSGQRQSVSAVWKHPGFSEKYLVNDVGLLLLEKPITSIAPTALLAASTLSKLVKAKDSIFEVVGWGKDQNGDDAFYLRKAVVVDESSFLQKKAKWWRNDVWIAAGKFNKKEKVYAGACNGDSGGPLFVNQYGTVAIAGVVSFGIAEECETNLPSVFARMSYYTKSIKEDGIPTLLLNESTRNRSLPSVIAEPRIVGTARTGQTLTCEKGTWSTNTSQISVVWSGVGVPYGTASASITLSDNTSGSARTFTCTVTGSNSNGSTPRVLTVLQPTKPVSTNSPSINGFPTSASSSSTTATCTPGLFSGATSVTQEWWIGDSFSPTSRLSAGNSIVINANFFSSNGGKYLYCISSASGEGGTATSTSRGALIPSFQKPQVQTFPTISGVKEWQSPAINTVATCAGWAWKSPVTQEVIEWYSNTTYSLTGATKVSTGAILTLTESFLTTYKSKYLMCAVSGTNLGGTMTMYDGLYLYYYPTSTTTNTPAPTSAPTPAPTPTPTQSPSSNAKVTSTSLTFSNGINSIRVGDVITCSVNVTGGVTSRVRFVWRNSNIAADVSYSSIGGFKEVTFVDEYTSQATFKLNVTSGVLQNIQGLYLDCLAYVEFAGGGGGTGYTKVKIPAADSTAVTPTPTPTPTPTTQVNAPSNPTIKSVSAGISSLVVNWDPPSSNGGAPISQYWVYIESSPGVTEGYCSTTGALTCTVSNLKPNTDYLVFVSAWNTVNGVNRSSGDTSSPRTKTKTLSDSSPPLVFDGSSEMIQTPGGWTYKLGMTPVLSLEVADNVDVTSVAVSLEANGVVVGTFPAALYSNGPLLTGVCATGNKCGIWRVNLSFTGSSFVGNWRIFAVAKDGVGNQSTRVLLREIPVSSG